MNQVRGSPLAQIILHLPLARPFFPCDTFDTHERICFNDVDLNPT